jgi:hypothetical protein
MNSTPVIKPLDVKEYTSKQSKYDCVGKLPLRDIILGPSGAGKGILLANMILDIYRGCFDRIYIFSPSINVDKTWVPVKQYIEKSQRVDPNKELIYFDHYNADALEKIVATQTKLAEHMKSQGYSKIYQVLIVIDDFADDASFSRHSRLLHALSTRGRHSMISTIVSTQKYRAISNIIRVNATNLYVFRLRNGGDLEALLEELNALTDKKSLLELCNIATAEPFSFWFIKLNSKTLSDMFYIRFDKKLVLE